ncbi:MAG: antitoxin Xre/MbcA/ParS toxin-binding domain-containing protein [Sphingorhabdus sp.]
MTAALARYIDDLHDHGGLKGTDIANIAQVSSATVHRWKAGSHLPHPREQLLLATMHYIVSRLEAYYDPKEIRIWLQAPHPQLEGRRAIDAIVEDKAEEVIAILDRMDAEAYL